MAGILALVLAVVLGIWSIADYVHNEQDRQRSVQTMTWAVLKNEYAFNSALDDANKAEGNERFDGIIELCQPFL